MLKGERIIIDVSFHFYSMKKRKAPTNRLHKRDFLKKLNFGHILTNSSNVIYI